MDRDAVEKVRQAARIEDVVRDRVQLKKSGKGYMGRCPFHEEKTPSFSVRPDRGRYKCFGCGASGDVFTWTMAFGRMGFLDAVVAVASRFGIPVEVPRGRRGGPRHKRRPEGAPGVAEARASAEKLSRAPGWDPGRAYSELRVQLNAEIDRACGEDRDAVVSDIESLDDMLAELEDKAMAGKLGQVEFAQQAVAAADIAAGIARARREVRGVAPRVEGR